MNVLDLFSGIGGFSLGLERAGMRTVAFCEIDPYCRAVLAKHWPELECHPDITARGFVEGEADVICGGFPCQDISNAGDRAGIAGERSGLWKHLLRAIRLVRPRYAIVENVAALLGRGMGDVLGDLAEIGQDAEWHCIPARAVGAPHIRDRVWIVVADPARGGHGLDGLGQALERQLADPSAYMADPAGCDDWCGDAEPGQRQEPQPRNSGGPRNVADARKSGLEGRDGRVLQERASEWTAGPRGSHLVDADRDAPRRSEGPAGSPAGRWCERLGERCSCYRHTWRAEPDVGRVAHGVPSRVDRLKGLGNAVVPQIPEIIGRAIMSCAVTSGHPLGEK